MVSTLVGSTSGTTNGAADVAKVSALRGMAWSQADNALIVSDAHTIRKVTISSGIQGHWVL